MKKIAKYQSGGKGRILLNANELSIGLPETVVREIADSMYGIAFNRYPDETQEELLAAYSRVCGMPPSCLLAGNGSDQMLGYLIGTFLGSGKTLFTLDPDFSMYDYYASTYETDVRKYRPEGSCDVESWIRQAEEAGADMIMFSNPNNPSGRCLPHEDITRLLESFRNIPVVVDEAYIEFADVPSCAPLTAEYENLFVTRTLSKAYGLAGVRTGFLIGNESVMKRLKDAFVPYALSTPAMKIASAVLAHAEEYQPVIEEIRWERERMYAAIKKSEIIEVLPSQANFLCCRTESTEELLRLMEENGIVIRSYPDGRTFRITVGTPEENDAVLSVLARFEEERS